MSEGASTSSRGTDNVNINVNDHRTTAGRAPASSTASIPRYTSNRTTNTNTPGSSSFWPPLSAPPTGPLPVPSPSPLPFPSGPAPGMATPSRPPNGPGSVLRQRGESSPVTSRHTARPSTSTNASSSGHSHGSNSLGDDHFPSKPFVRKGSSTAAEGLGLGLEPTTASSSTSTSRRAERPFDSTNSADQWTTTRDQRERAYSNGKGPATEARPARRQHYVETFDNHDENFISGPIASTSAPSNAATVASSSSSRSQPFAPSASLAAPNSSKSVLTIALQRAQSAVLLDSANNVPAAISAYSSSVRLLKEVMARVEDGARRDREKLNERGGDRYAVRPGETEEDAQKRIARIERKERAKMDEARRLKVIHDTYEDRIRMLQSIESEQGDATPKPIFEESGSAPRASARTEPIAAPYITAPPMVSRRSRNRSISSLETVSIPPATFASSTQAGVPSDDLSSAQPLSSLDETDTTPKLAAEPFRRPSPAPTGFDGTTAGPRRPSLSPERLRTQATTERPVQFVQSAGSDNLAVKSHQRVPSNASDDSDDRVPVTARETASSWPTRPENETARESESTLTPAGHVGQGTTSHSPTPGAGRTGASPQPSQHAFQPYELRRTASDQPSPSASPDLSWSNETRAALSSAAATQPLDEATKRTTGVRTSSLLAAGYLPPGEEVPRWIDARPRPVRAATSAIGATGTIMNNSASTQRRESASPLVNDSTTTGTISQRRRSSQAPSPLIGTETTPGIAVKASGAHLETMRDEDLQRDGKNAPGSRVRADVGPSASSPTLQSASVASTSFLNDFGPTTASDGAYSSASLPMRLRTHSQPSQRPSLSSFQNQPPVPSIVTVVDRSVSSNGPPQMIRKSSVPSPTSPAGPGLGRAPPSLVRANSVSSQGSHSERDVSHRGAPSPFWNYLDTFASSREVLNGASTGRQSMAAVGEYPASSSHPTSLEPSSPTVPLATGAPSSDAGALGTSPVRRPFYLMRQILQTIETDGAYITPTLYIPHQVWSQVGVKLVAVETKVRMLDLLLTGLEAVDKLGKTCWRTEGGRGTREAAARFTKELESFEGLTEGIQSTLSKKLGYASTGKKVGTNSFSAWSSKLSRSLDRVTNGRSLDHPATYVDSIARVLQQAQCLDVYLVTMQDRSFPLSEMDERDRAQMALRLKRLSEFFGGVICRFILRDIGMLVDKYVKRAGIWFSENSN